MNRLLPAVLWWHKESRNFPRNFPLSSLLGVTRVTALAAALIGLIEIPLAPIWAWLLFAEKPNALIVIGGVMIITAAVAYTLKMKGKTP